MNIIGLDTETTGLQPGDHRFVEVYAGTWDLRTKSLIRDFNKRIDPERSIGAEAQRVHGISISDLVGCPPWEKVGPDLHKELQGADLIVAHNGKGFDLPFLNYEFKRINLEPIDKPLVDTMLEGRWGTFDGSVPSLQKLCFACDVDYDPALAHAADYDVKVMMECFFRALAWGSIKLPETLTTELAHAA